MKFKIVTLLFLSLLTGLSQAQKKTSVTKKTVSTSIKSNADSGIFAEIETSKGKIMLQLEYSKTPITVANFIALAEGKQSYITDEKLKNKPFYDGLKFHRVIKDFMIQGGDPAGNGSGGTGYSFKDEFDPSLVHDKGGILSMANSGPGTNSSQFFITHKDTPWLNNKHTIFGHVVSGMDVVNAIVQDDVINKVTIIRKGSEAKNFDAVKVFSAYYANKADDDKKQAEMKAAAEKIANEKEAEEKRAYEIKYAPVKEAKVKKLAELRATATKSETGLETKVLLSTFGSKPAEGATVFINYAGYLEDGTLFDSCIEDVAKQFGKFDQRRFDGGGYKPMQAQAGNYRFIPGFTEGLNKMSFGDKVVLFIPAGLAYGANGAGNVIPPNANIIFELELLEKAPEALMPATGK